MPRTWTDEEKEQQRQRMLQLHADGRAGGQFGKLGGRPKKPRASERVAERVSGEGDFFYDRHMEIARNGRDGEALRAMDKLLNIEEQERKIDAEEEQRIDELNRTQLLEVVRTQWAELLRRGIVGADPVIDGDVIDGTVTGISESAEVTT